MSDNSNRDKPASQTAHAAFLEGLSSPWIGWHYMRQHPSLWRYGLMPLLMNLLVAILLLAALVALVGYLTATLHPNYPDGWLGRAFEVLVILAVSIAGIGLFAIMWVILQGIFCGYFYSILAEKVELQLGLKQEDIKQVPFSNQILDTLSGAGRLALVNIGLLMLHCVPGIGSIIGVCGSYYYTCMTLGLDFFEYPLALRGKRSTEMRAFARKHRPHTLGLGTGVAVVSLIPIVNAVLLTTVVAGAVLLHRQLVLDVDDGSV
jgi:uncharacterized protein involved in cysteine biosynthesis